MNSQNVLLWLEYIHSNSHINQMLPQIVHILRFCLVDNVALDFIVNWIRSGLFGGHKSGSSYG